MSTSTMIEIAVAAIVVIAVLTTLVFVARHKRLEHRRAQAGEIRDDAAEQAHKVGQREALADETAARARVAAAEADAQSARARALAHQAEERRTAAVTARGEVNQQLQRADTLDPDTQADHAQRENSAAIRDVPPARRTR